MYFFDLESVGSPLTLPSGPLDANAFGARYVSYRGINRFLEQIDELDPGVIVWPGGTLAETRTDRFGFEYEGLYAPETGKPGLDDMMQVAIDEGAALSMIVPTLRYAGDPDALADDLRSFLGELLGGDYGPLPSELILEIGNEYYAHFPEVGGAADYAELADAAVTEIALALADPAVNPGGADVTIAVQTGRTMADDDAIRAGLSDFAQSNVDMIIHHRFAFQPEGIDTRAALTGDILDIWTTEASALDGEVPELFVSEWNVASYTRDEALADFVTDTGRDPATVDLAGRTDTQFETYWQTALGNYAYGPEHPAMILETFTSYAEEGAGASAMNGFDSIHPGRLSLRDVDGTDRVFVGGEMYEMMRESLVGMTPIGPSEPYDKDAPATLYGFEDDDKLVAFIAAGETPPGEVEISLEGLEGAFIGVWADSLEAQLNPTWKEDFGIPDTPGVDETPEAWTYADGVRGAADTELTVDGIAVALDAPHQILRIAFAKTEAGSAQIAGWSDDDGVALEEAGVLPDLPDIPPPPIEEEDDADEAGFDGDGGGGGGGGAIAAIGILPLLFLGF